MIKPKGTCNSAHDDQLQECFFCSHSAIHLYQLEQLIGGNVEQAGCVQMQPSDFECHQIGLTAFDLRIFVRRRGILEG